jgi:hypothetical protein
MLAQTHLSHVSCRTQHTRYQDDVGECDPSCPFRPAEILVAVDGHVCSSSVPRIAYPLFCTLYRNSCTSEVIPCYERAHI